MTESVLKKIVPRTAILLIIVFCAQKVYVALQWDSDLWDRGQMLAELQQLEDSCRVLYFGESSNFSYHPTRDSLTDRISDFISYSFPDLTFGTINHAAYHAGMFLPLIRQINADSKVECVIITMNLRTFGQAVTHSPLETSLQQEKVLYSNYPELLRRTFLTLNYFDNQTEMDRDFRKWKAWTFDTLKSADPEIRFPNPTIRSWCATEKFLREDGTEDMELRTLADHYIKAYAFQILENNPRVSDFDQIVNECRKKKIRVVFNLLAENTGYAERLVGKNLVWLIRQNRDFLVDRYTRAGALVADNLESVEGIHYTDQNWTTEHYDQTGRQRVANGVAIALRGFYPDQYKPVESQRVDSSAADPIKN